ncbi:hypothetical protein EMCG_06918 [[Emmonsia] crescens]|uniref:Uncharacterized protein n=1 Tax=[Emmonsia] crescens TaxID=73230 RepID=A0A0G2JBF5_9EURO|nr:hypothetical protein EMCG_06918 [Emmonsia crescens UAMH 3008]
MLRERSARSLPRKRISWPQVSLSRSNRTSTSSSPPLPLSPRPSAPRSLRL